MLVVLVLMAAASFAAAAILPWALPLPPSVHIHLALAAGVIPLIFGAMVHFVPVLTRSASPHAGIKTIPPMTSTAGMLAVFSFAAANQIYYLAALLALAVASAFSGWIIKRASAPLAKPHPCLHWYLAAIFCLMLALAAVAAMTVWPEQRLALKRLHLHLNTLGFIGLTAIATLQVLLPTAAGRPDPQAASRLRLDLKWAVSGTLLTAIGAAWLSPLSWLGALLWAIPLLRLGRAWLALYSREMRRLHGAVPSLAAALAGFAAVLIFGALHAGGILNATDTAHAFILAFLFPLVSGAASQLLAVWARPGPQNAWHIRTRQRLGFSGGLRGALFVGGGLLLGIGWRDGWLLALVAFALFLLQLAYTVKTMLKRDGAD
jgi:hypothetical protein